MAHTKHKDRHMQVLNAEERFQISLLTLIEIAANVLKDRNQPGTRRSNKITAIIAKVEEISETYHGSITEEFASKAEEFYQQIEASLTELVKTA